MKRTLKIGTRESPLAMWQAHLVQNQLAALGIQTDIFPVKSEGDIDLVTPLYAMGVQGVFTKTLDAYLLSGHIDIAVHSMKDVPVQLAQGLKSAAVLKRAPSHDVIVWRNGHRDHSMMLNTPETIGTGSIRRKSQWLHRYPQHQVENLRGNVQTRLQKLNDSQWVGAIFAAAGLQRMELDNLDLESLEWMIPAPAQGAIMIACRTGDEDVYTAVHQLNDKETEMCVTIERDFLNALHGGCSAPIGAHVYADGDNWVFEGCVATLNGEELISIKEIIDLHHNDLGQLMAEKIKNMGADTIIEGIRGL